MPLPDGGPGRPGYHVSTPRGWINDPHGVTWYGGRYHLFFQYNPESSQWSPRCSWGHLTGPDLVRWGSPVTVALAPGDGDDGIWSGALVVDGDRPTILYTSAVTDRWGHGRIALATADPDLEHWTKRGPPVLEAPAGVTEFRDPCVVPVDGGWRMVVGCRRDGAAAALQYSSTDLTDWTYDGVLCARTPEPPLHTGDAWECVQLFPLDGAWVLLASAWTGRPSVDGVVYAVGDYDGAAFTPWTWRPFEHGGALYATTTFRDADGRWCALSWCREAEPARAGRARAGALSLPHRLALDGDRLVVSPHPDVERLRTGEVIRGDLAAGPVSLGPVGRQSQVTVNARLARRLRLALRRGGSEDLVLVADPDAGELLVGATCRMPLGAAADGSVQLMVLLDEDIAEVFAGGDVAVVRIPVSSGEGTLALSADGPVHHTDASVHALDAWFHG